MSTEIYKRTCESCTLKQYWNKKISVADPGCLSRIPDPDFYPSRIQDSKTATKERGENFFFVKHFFVATNFTKCKIIYF
jgi:hypothetical protein